MASVCSVVEHDTVTSVQCMTFGFYPRLRLLFVCFHFKRGWMRTRDRSSKKGLWCYFCVVSVSHSAIFCSAPHDGVIIAHETVIHESFFIFYFFAEWMKRTKTQSGEWYKTRFNGNTQQKLSSLQTCHSVLHCVCEDFPKLRCTFLCCTTTTTTIMGSIAAGRLVCEETLRRLVFLDRKISFSICFVPRAASVSDWCSL